MASPTPIQEKSYNLNTKTNQQLRTLAAAARPFIIPGLLVAFVLVNRLTSLQGFANAVAWILDDNPIFYAHRFMYPDLYQRDLWANYGHETYVFISVFYLLPALPGRYAGVEPISVAYLQVLLVDILLIWAVYLLAQELFHRQIVSIITALLVIAARVMSWNIAHYGFIGFWYPYPGDTILPFKVLVIVLLLQRRHRATIVLTGLLSYMHPSQAIYMVLMVGLYLLLSYKEIDWRPLRGWAFGGLILFIAGIAPGFLTRATIRPF